VIAGEASTPVAEKLIRRGIPWARASANFPSEVSTHYPQAPPSQQAILDGPPASGVENLLWNTVGHA